MTRTRTGTASVRSPDWSAEVVAIEDQAEFAVLAVSDDPPRVGVITHRNRLEIFGDDGRRLGQAPELDGVGRVIRTAPGYMAASTDRRMVLCDLRHNTGQRIDLSLAELTHLSILPDSFGLGIVQERDRVGRATAAGRWIWKVELDSPVEELAIDPEGLAAVTTADGRLIVFGPDGTRLGESTGRAGDPAFLARAPEGWPTPWVTLARRSQAIRAHHRDGRVAWESPVAFEGWQFQVVGLLAVVVAADGRAVAYDASGRLVAQARGEGPADAFYPGPNGEVLRVTRQGVHLICSDLGGRVAWRAVADGPLGPLAAARAGVAVMIGESVAWYSASGYG